MGGQRALRKHAKKAKEDNGRMGRTLPGLPKAACPGKMAIWERGEAAFGSKHLEGGLSILEIQLTVAWQLRLQKGFPSKQQAEGSLASQAVNNPRLGWVRGAQGEFLTTPSPKQLRHLVGIHVRDQE